MKSDKNIREGYKRTTVGVIPEEWEVKKIDELTKYYDGTHQTPIYEEKGIPFYSVQHVTANDFSDTKFISEEVFEKESERVVMEKGDILMTRIGDVGTAKLIDWDVKASFYVSLALIKQCDDLDSKFFEQSINGALFQRVLHKKIIHVAFPKKINLGEIGKLKLPIPPLPEQQAIANCLTTWDSGIEKLTQLIAAKREQKKGLMQQLLTGKKRLDGFVGEWKRIKFSEFSNVVRGGSPRPINEYITTNDNGLNWLRIGDIDEDSKFIYSTEEKIKIEGLNKTRLIKKGELILSNSMSFGRPFILKTECCIHDGWLAITEISDSVDREFLYYLISEDKIQSRFEHLAAGSGVRNLNKELISNFLIKLPPYDEQKAIAKILDTADQEITILEEKLAAMKEEKKGLMQVLLTGQKRLIDS